MLVVGTRVVIEVDGAEYHSSRERFENDRRRDAELASRGYLTIRLSYDQVMNNWPWCEARILAVLSQFRSLWG
jgi:very-short-patch-repair endonuclease